MTPLFGDEAFRRDHGSYLSNVRPGLPAAQGRPGTCRVCAGPVSAGYLVCRQCEDVRAVVARDGRPFPLDWLAFLTYAVEGAALASRVVPGQVKDSHEREGRQAYLVLRGYKAGGAGNPWRPTAVSWTVWFLQRWGPWAAWPQRRDHREWLWATVPSVRSVRRGKEHPLHGIVSAVLDSSSEVVLRSADGTEDRTFNPRLFDCAPVPGDAPVLLVDDSWTSGANLLSAAAALREAGASNVNAMVLGRLLNPGAWPPTRDFIDHDGLSLDFGDGLRPGFDPARDPWTKVA
jgi:hypothetical protein